ncbi:hypothetical protein LTS15_010146 [Exophiala xenobiotica]|nr:hypothetical protein LTS15_010146 [Exophiala xenobiotica]
MARPQQVVEVFPSQEELAAGRLNTKNIRKVLEGLHTDGIVLLRDIINPGHLDAINVRMVKEAEDGVRAGLFFQDLYCNKIIHHAVELYLGEGATWDLVTGNTALPRSTKRQPVHSDANFQHPNCPFYCVANIPLITSEVATGATEIWLGGQHRGNIEDQAGPGELAIHPDLVAAREKVQPPIQPTVPKGSAVLRDLRLWHAGMPNPSDQWRCMIALGFSAPWYRCTNSFGIPAGSGIAEQIEDGLRDTACTAKYHEVPQQEYDGSRYALDFNFLEEEQEEEEVGDVVKMPATAAASSQILATGTGRASTMSDNVFKELEVAPTHLKVN